MELSLYVVKEHLEKEFSLGREHLDEERLFRRVTCYLGEDELDSAALYILEAGQAEGFLRSAGAERCSAVIVSGEPADGPWAEAAGQQVPGLAFLSVQVPGGAPALPAVLASVQRLLDRLRDWENRLLDLRGRGRAMREFLQVGYEVIQNPMILYDSSYLITATTQKFHSVPEVSAWNSLVAAGYWIPEFRSVVRAENWHSQSNCTTYYETNSFECNGAITAFSHHACYLGTLFVMEYFHPISKGDLRLIQIFSDYLLQELLDTEQTGTHASAMDTFVHTLLFSDSNSYPAEFINYHLAGLGWKEQDTFYVILFSDMFRGKQPRQYAPEYIHRWFPDSYCLEVKDQLVAIIRADPEELESITGTLAELLRDSLMKCGISAPASTFPGIRFGYRQAGAALSIGEMLDPTFWSYKYEDYSVEYLVSFALKSVRLETICHPAILVLDREDRETGSQYIATLDAYLSSDGNLKKLADAMHMHRNTLQYRLNRISQLTGIHFDDGNENQRLYLSIKLLRVYRAAGPDLMA